MRRTLAATFIALISLLGLTALAQQGPSPIGPIPGGGSVTGSSPIVVTGSVISCPTCGTGTGNAQTANPLSQFASTTSAQLAGVLSDETGTGAAVFANTPTLVTPVLGVATGTSLSLSGQFTSTQATGTAPFVVASTTNVANLNASSLSGATFAAPGAIGSGTASTGAFTTLTASSTTTLSGAGAASTSPFLLNGTPFVAGTGTTNFPYAYLNFGSAPTTFNTSGVLFGINGPTGFAGNAIELHANGGGVAFSVGATGNIGGVNVVGSGSITGAKYLTGTNCSASGTSANPSIVTCSSAASGAFACATAASGGTCQVNTTAVGTNSNIQITQTASAGTRLSVTCNTTADTPTAPRIASISNGASFTINLGTVTTNPTCYFYTITN